MFMSPGKGGNWHRSLHKAVVTYWISKSAWSLQYILVLEIMCIQKYTVVYTQQKSFSGILQGII